MKKFLLVIFCVASLPSFAQFTVNRKIAQRWDKYVGNSWQGQDSLIFLYDAYGNQTFRFAVAGQTGNWLNNYRTTTTYDAQQNESTRTLENWSSNGWDKISKYSYTYNSSNLETQVLYQTWNTATSGWKNTGRLVTTYNGSQLKSQYDSYTWDGSTWQPGTRQLFSYNASNELITHEYYFFDGFVFAKQERNQYQHAFGFVSSQITSIPDGSSNWVPQTRILSLINGSASPPHPVSRRTQSRDLVNSTWVDSLRVSYSYNGNLLIQSERERYFPFTTTWVNQELSTFAYNGSSLLTDEKNYTYSQSTSSYLNNLRKVFTYNGNNLNDQITFYDDDGSGGWKTNAKAQLTYNTNDSLVYRLNENYSNASFVPHEQFFYHYKDIPVGLKDYNNLFNEAVLYPNPSTEAIKIRTNEKINGAYTSSIYNLKGQKIWSQFNNKNAPLEEFDISFLPQGNYILQINEVATGRLQHFKFGKQ